MKSKLNNLDELNGGSTYRFTAEIVDIGVELDLFTWNVT